MLVCLPVLFTLVTNIHVVNAAACFTGWFGPDCQFRCQCDKTTWCFTDGRCSQKDFCKVTYFGPGCQYADLVALAADSSTPHYLSDAKDETCNPDRNALSLQVSLVEAFPFTWFRIVVNRTLVNLMNFTVELNDGQECLNERRFVVSKNVVDVTCDGEPRVRKLTIADDIPPFVCSLYISGDCRRHGHGSGRNMAIQQETWMSTVILNDWTKNKADNAIDGNRNNEYEHYSCSHTTREPTGGEWQLTFNTSQVINRILVVNRNDYVYRLDKFTLETFNQAGRRIEQYRNNKPGYQWYHVLLNSKLPIKSFKIKQSTHFTKPEDQALVLCEVEAYMEPRCTGKYYGLDCRSPCKCKTSEVCSTVTGACALGCHSGFFGSNCSLHCSVNCLNTVCSVESGECLNCKDGYYGAQCNKQCNPGTFGQACASTCSPQCVQACNHINGACTCKKPFTGYMCADCMPGTFGYNCSEVCSVFCKDQQCDAITGQCFSCVPNHVGRHCEECDVGFYGVNCSHTCPTLCQTNTCHNVTGECFSCVETRTGWQCEECDVGYYGVNCSHTCPILCQSNRCHNVTGDCFSCVANRRGQQCKDCDGRFAGVNCTECTWTFAGPDCRDCATGYYGENCTESCPKYCVDRDCNQDTGYCVSCIGNRHGLHCEECTENRYGPLCQFECTGQCLNGTCDPLSGLCVYCAEGYDGEYCLGAEPTYYLYLAPLLPLYLLMCCCILGCAETIQEKNDYQEDFNVHSEMH